MPFARVIGAVLLFSVMLAGAAAAQTPEHGNLEFAMLGGLTVLMPHEDGDNTTMFTVPQGSAGVLLGAFPSFRMTYWTRSALLADLGFSLVTASEDGDSFTAFNIEGGIGAVLGPRTSRTTGFVTGLFGLLSTSNGDSRSEGYLGGQAGIRTMINDYSAFRFQAGYRSMLGDEFDFSTLEIAAGLSFFL